LYSQRFAVSAALACVPSLPPSFLTKAIEGTKRLSANGLRYLIPQYGIQSDARAALAVSYGSKEKS
jgi:hypothetical protein